MFSFSSTLKQDTKDEKLHLYSLHVLTWIILRNVPFGLMID